MTAVKVLYLPGGPVHEGIQGPFSNTRLMWGELAGARELVWRLMVRDFRARYRQSALGVSWAVLPPLATTAVFVAMNGAGLLNAGAVPAPYALYALAGLTFWNLFAGVLTAATRSLVEAGSVVVKINVPKVALVVAATGPALVDFAVRIVLLASAFAYFGQVPASAGLAFALLAALPLYLAALGLGFVGSVAACIVRDTPNVLTLTLLAGMLVTPVVYAPGGSALLFRVNDLNPLNFLVNAPRDMLFAGRSELLKPFLASAAASVALFLVGWRVFYFSQTKLAERL